MITFGELAFSLTVAVGGTEGFSCLAVRLMTNPVINIVIIPSAILMEVGFINCNLSHYSNKRKYIPLIVPFESSEGPCIFTGGHGDLIGKRGLFYYIKYKIPRRFQDDNKCRCMSS
jgi:hypothetical protein